jgi:hypothetical protein
MLSPAQSYVLRALLALMAIPSLAGETVEGLVFNTVQGSGGNTSGGNCTGPFFLWQEPDPYFQNVKRRKVKGSVRFERKGKVLENFPDEVTLQLAFLPSPPFTSCPATPQRFDPAKIKFKAAWRNGLQTSPAEGVFVISERQGPGIWCEDSCAGSRGYELRIDSAGVPLTHQLEITVEAENGSPIAQFTGELRPHDPQNVLTPVLTVNSNHVSPITELAKP